jgi:Uma2 family endonuclease
MAVASKKQKWYNLLFKLIDLATNHKRGTMQLTFNQIVIQPGQQLLLQDISWSMFEALLTELGEHRATRLSYSEGKLELMAPMAVHELGKEIIGDLVKIILEELNLEFLALGSITLKNGRMSRAVEPDECFYIQHEAAIRGKDNIDLTIDPPPDLAIEIDITSRTHLDNYEQLGVPELWRYDGQHLEIQVLIQGRYVTTNTSRQFPQFPLTTIIPHYLQQTKVKGRNATMRAFRTWVQQFNSSSEM